MHRHDGGNFFPGTGDPQEIGKYVIFGSVATLFLISDSQLYKK